MFRIFLFVAIIWLVSKVARLIFIAMRRTSTKETHRPKYGFGKSPSATPQVDFKNVKDAEFEDLPEKDKVSK